MRLSMHGRKKERILFLKLKRLLCLLLSAALLCTVPVSALAGTPFAPGDPSGDGEVTAEDARLCLRCAVGLESFAEDSPEYLACDVDEETGVSAADARLILRVAVGLETLSEPVHEHTVESWTPETDETGALTGKHTGVCTACGETLTADCTYGEKVFDTENEVPTCLEGCSYSETCTVCGEVRVTKESALGHTFEEDGSFPVDQDAVCGRCGEKQLCFNTLVNALKRDAHIYTGFSESSNTGTVTKDEIKISPMAKAAASIAGENLDEEEIRKQLKEEMLGEGHIYSDYAAGREITNDSFYLAGRDIVSALTADDVKNATAETMEGVDFIAELPDSIKIQSMYSSVGFQMDLTEKIKAANIGEVLKVTVELKDESYADIKDSETETALQRATDLDLRDMVAELNQSQDQDGMTLEMKCDKATSACTIVYYFDAVTLLPIAAKYDLKVDSSESMDMKMVLDTGIKIGLIELKGELMKCSLAFDMTSCSTNYYFFDHYFD